MSDMAAEMAALRAQFDAMAVEMAAARAARTEADARADAEAAARADADAQLARALAPLALATPGAANRTRTVPTTLVHEHQVLVSPTAAEANFLEGRLVALIDAPVSVPADAAAAAAFTALVKQCEGARGIMAEQACYAHAVAHLPVFAERVGTAAGDMAAVTLFSTTALHTTAWTFAGACKPELHVRARIGAGEPDLRPAFNGELKSAGDKRALEQAAYYTAMDMVRVFFPATDGGRVPCARRFFSRPPVGYALVGFPHVAYFIALEWVGKLLVAPVSAPFFIGSDAHRAAAEALPDVRYDPPVLLPERLAWLTPEAADARDRTAWCVTDGVFRKLVRGDARSGAGFAAMHSAYARLAAILGAAPPQLHLVRHVRLAYGAHEVLVEMPAVAGCEAADADVTRAGPLLTAVAASVVWLARQGVVYTDLRGPNVLVDNDSGAPWLVDFDDCLAVGQSVTTLVEYKAHLAASPGAGAPNTFAGRLVGGALPAVADALEAAFVAAAAAAVQAAPVEAAA